MIGSKGKQAVITFFSESEKKLEAFINKIRIPRLLSFVVTKSGKINPTLEEALRDASKSSDNWKRLGLGKKVLGTIPVWVIIALPILMYVVSKASLALQFFIEIGSQAFMLIPLALILYYIYKSFKK